MLRLWRGLGIRLKRLFLLLGTIIKTVVNGLDVEGFIILGGLGMIFYGLYHVSIAAAYIVSGALLYILGYIILKGGK